LLVFKSLDKVTLSRQLWGHFAELTLTCYTSHCDYL